MVGLDPNFLALSKPNEVKEMLKRLVEEIGNNPFILGTSDALVPGTPIRNLEIISETIRKL